MNRRIIGLFAIVVTVGMVPQVAASVQDSQAEDFSDENVEWYLDQADLEEVPETTATVYTNDGVKQVSAEEAFERLGERSADLPLSSLAVQADHGADDGAADHAGDVFLSEIAGESGERTLDCDIFTGVEVSHEEQEVEQAGATVYNGSVGVGDSDIATKGGGLHVDRITQETHFHEGHEATWVGNTDFFCLELDIPIIDRYLTIHQSDINGVLEIQ
jgi:hypothetical protein